VALPAPRVFSSAIVIAFATVVLTEISRARCVHPAVKVYVRPVNGEDTMPLPSMATSTDESTDGVTDGQTCPVPELVCAPFTATGSAELV
jgi:hypothetical protein